MTLPLQCISDCIRLQIAVPLSKYAGACIRNLYVASECKTYEVPKSTVKLELSHIKLKST